ncbi:hypothetical protein A3A95_04300 [Candidatus Nomurabacteria bacterium RIFCSPLOWO2_01_FULL_39_18]|uniref:Uncharacterized protein n=1 Tax=Candidatus Nomurabacteria bacterium RIFCSPHIGHO2_01_FULL_40_24b TaxID=1801739 RepID=A0A1F6V6I5_9BACT|nr:MAG: hypothetical protein A2647_04225 [Candidatus Nomurabacteria bacterium RIFCSPHIGHO2_01_FULL_40_24b]OGI89318.1 MAG: hypothetical protein A3A95_04300 [Candidatus Nomurabacteria bacterium RIFCSPLOWO2_01_FULL_39_18]
MPEGKTSFLDRTMERLMEEDEPKKWFDLNEVVSCRVEDDNEISIHLESKQEKPLVNLKSLARSGLEKLAEMLEKEDRFKKIKLVTATSWVVTEHPDLITKALGFTIDNENKFINSSVRKIRYKYKKKNIPLNKIFIKPGFAFMSREEFLDRFGSKNKKKNI